MPSYKIYVGAFSLALSLTAVVLFGDDTNGITLSPVEADWLKQAESWRAIQRGPVPNLSTGLDAAGAVDGVRNGGFGFHTNRTPNPWWQVDLEQSTPIARIVVYNRLDYAPGLHIADAMQVLVSDDAKKWMKIHDCAGKHFGGIRGEKPLELVFKPGELSTRFVRLSIPSGEPVFFHLDEVEIFSTD